MGSGTSNNDGSNGSAVSVATTVHGIVDAVSNDLLQGLATYAGFVPEVGVVNDLLGYGSPTSFNPIDILDDTVAASGPQTPTANAKITAKLAIGGSGGGGGAGGAMTVTNSGTIGTMGHHSDGILAQSIGGGGGKGGAASIASPLSLLGSFGVGGTGGDGTSSNGGTVLVTNSGAVYTVGALAGGIVAQSIGSGGGLGGVSFGTTVADDGDDWIGLGVTLGGSAGGTGISEAAQVQSSGAIETRGHDKIGRAHV